MSDFVSGRSLDRFTPSVTVHDRPIPWDERPAIRPTFVSHASQAAMETEAETKRTETETKPKAGRKRTASKFSVPDPFHGCDDWYQPDPQVRRMQREVNRIRDRMESITELFGTIVKPNRAHRREYVAILKRMQHEIDMVK